jgi:hypothetical protein
MRHTHHHRPGHLPTPSKRHATCPWCSEDLTTIVALIDHVDARHVAAGSDAA